MLGAGRQKKEDDIYGVRLKTKKDITIKIKNVFNKKQITLLSKNDKIIVNDDNGYYTLNLKKGNYKII